MYSDDTFRGHMMQALLTCNPDVFRYLWMAYTDPLKCPLEISRRFKRYQDSIDHRPDSEVIGLILGHGKRW